MLPELPNPGDGWNGHLMPADALLRGFRLRAGGNTVNQFAILGGEGADVECDGIRNDPPERAAFER